MTKNKEKYNEYMRNWRKENRQKKIKELGGKCKRCGENRFEMLSITKEGALCHNCREYLNQRSNKN